MPGAIPPLLQFVFIAWCLVKHRGNFTFAFIMMVDFFKGGISCYVNMERNHESDYKKRKT